MGSDEIGRSGTRAAGYGRRAASAATGLGIAALVAAAPAAAQYAASCPPPKKLAAGACVAACPGGYEDRGSTCVYRSLSR